MHILSLKTILKYAQNSLYCNLTKAYINRAFVCDHYSNYSAFNSNSLKNYCMKDNEIKFVCHSSNKTVNFYKLCNYVYDCDDGSDEKNCGNKKNNSLFFFIRNSKI